MAAPRWWWCGFGVGCQVFGQLGWQEGGELRLRLTLRLTLRLRPSWKICCDIHSPWQPQVVVVGFGGGLPGFWPAGMVGGGSLGLSLGLHLGLHLGLGLTQVGKLCCDIHSFAWLYTHHGWWWWVLGWAARFLASWDGRRGGELSLGLHLGSYT